MTVIRTSLALAAAVAFLSAACAKPVPATSTPAPPARPDPWSIYSTGPGTGAATPLTTVTPWMPAGAPEYCISPEKGQLQSILGTPASPYFVHHPIVDNPGAPTVIFLGGGEGSRRSAQRVWANYLSHGRGVDDFRAVLPYSVDIDYLDYGESRRTYRVLDEVLACYGGDPRQVHIAGFSNGGYVAYELMLDRPDRFATLLGAPGLFPVKTTPEQWAKPLCGHAVFNGVGARDFDWIGDVRATHEGLLKMGANSVYVEFEGQGHGLSEAFDESVFFDFWRANPAVRPTDGAGVKCQS